MKFAKRRLRDQNSSQRCKNGLVKSEQFQELTKLLRKKATNLMEEMKKEHIPIFYDWINSKLQCIDETIELVNRSPNLSINELAESLDQKIEANARKLNGTTEFSRMEVICNRLSALEWTRNIVRTIDLNYRLT